MRAIVMVTGLMVVGLNAQWAMAEDAVATGAPMKRQLVVCMTKSMSARKTLSYNEAQRECKAFLSGQNQVGPSKRALTANASEAPGLKAP